MDTSRAGEARPGIVGRASSISACKAFFFFRKIVYLPIGFVRKCDMKMYVRYFIIGFLSLVSSCVNEKEDAGMQPDAVEVGDMLPEFTVVMNDGRTVESGSLQGQPRSYCSSIRRAGIVAVNCRSYNKCTKGTERTVVWFLWPSVGSRTH